MRLIQWVPLGLFFACVLPSISSAADRVFVFPSSNNDVVTVRDADDLSANPAVAAPRSSFAVEQAVDGSVYFIVSRTANSAITVVDATTLEVLDTIDLGASPSDAAVTPDGKYLLVAAGSITVIDTKTLEVVKQILVGTAPTRVIIDDSSERAYSLANFGGLVSLIDLDLLAVAAQKNVPSSGDIALSADGATLLVAQRVGIASLNPANLSGDGVTPGRVDLVNPTLVPLPSSNKVIVVTRGSAPANTSQLIDLVSGEARTIGGVSTAEFSQIVAVDDTQAFGILTNGPELVELDLTATPNVTLDTIGFAQSPNDLVLSPGGRELFVTSLVEAALFRIATGTATLTKVVGLPLTPSGVDVAFAPSAGPPVEMSVNGGDGQFAPPGAQLPIALTVRVLDADGQPVRGTSVRFDDTSEAGLQFSPSPDAVTNSRGVATVRVTVPLPAAGAQQQQQSRRLPANAKMAGLSGERAAAEGDVIDQVRVSASAAGLESVGFTINVIRSVGLVLVSGNNQIVAPNGAFPVPIVFLATDASGNPLPAGTAVNVSAFFAECPSSEGGTDENGFVSAQCLATGIPSNAGQAVTGGVVASIFQFQEELGFDLVVADAGFTVSRGANQFGIEKIDGSSGDNQTGRSGEALASPLRFRVTLGGFGPGPTGVEVTQLSGPPVLFDPSTFDGFPGPTQEIFVTLGRSAGTSVLQVRALAPGLPTAQFTMIATGGQPVRLDKFNDGQSGRVLTALDTPLRVQVVNETGDTLRFPEVVWQVVSGDAQLAVQSDAAGSSAAVTFGPTPGPVQIRATIGALQAVFNVSATAPQPASIAASSGIGQTLLTGNLSAPLVVRVNEVNNAPAAGIDVTFAGPPSVLLHPAGGGSPGNPVVVTTNAEGFASAQAELLVVGSIGEQGAPRDQLARTITITASVSEPLTTSFLLNVTGRKPEFTSAGVVNGATFQPGITPGGIASIFGTGLMEGVIGVESAGGATSFEGTTVRIGGIAAPLLNLAAGPPEQINLQVPFEVSPNGTTTVEIENNGSRMTISGVPVFSAQPGIFEIPLSGGGTIGAAIHLNGQLVSPQNPADRGEVLSLFYTGGGRLSPSVPTGVLGPAPPAVINFDTLVGVDNKGSEVLFSGYAPSFLGLYQINFIVPDGASCGTVPLSIRLGEDTFSRPASTIAVRCP